MTKQHAESVNTTSADINEERSTQLRQLFPEAFTEGKIDFDKLRAALGDLIDDRPERYSFTWAGKQDAIRILQTPTSATLIPAPDESVDFNNTQNIFIEGDNLEVLKLLYKSYFGRVKMIYIDPPYNTGNDFIYPDNYADPLDTYLQLTGQKDAEGNLLSTNSDISGRYHSSWLTMMYPRLFIARQLLQEDGVIFVSIDENELKNVRQIMDEIFGEENFVATVIWQKVFAPKNTARHFSEDHDYIVVYARTAEIWKPNLLPRREEANSRYKNPDNDPRGPWASDNLTARNFYGDGSYEVTSPRGKKYTPPRGRYWVYNYKRFQELERDNRIWWGESGTNMPRLKRFLSEVQQGVVPQTLWTYQEVGHTQEAKKELLKYVNFKHTENVLNSVKPPRLIQRILHLTTERDKEHIILDFFAGSASTAHAVFAQNLEDDGNRRFILIQFPEPLPKPESNLLSIADMGKQRVRNVAQEMKLKDEGKMAFANKTQHQDLGFKVFKLAPTNFRAWQGTAEVTPEEFASQMALFTDPLVEGWRAPNVIYEIALKEGYSLNCYIQRTAVAGHEVYRVTDQEKDQHFYICLDNQITENLSAKLQLKPTDLFVCRDIALDDTMAANLALQSRLKTI